MKFLSTSQKWRADQLISILRHQTLKLRYDHIADLNDGRGYVAGIADFSTAQGSLLQLVEAYSNLSASNLLLKYLPNLKALADRQSPDVSNLLGLKDAWRELCTRNSFKGAQHHVSDTLYYGPAMLRANRLCLKYDLSKIALYEALIFQGETGPGSLDEIISMATRAMCGCPDVVPEEKWLLNFLQARREVVLRSHPETNEPIERAEAMLRIFGSGNLRFEGVVKLEYAETEFAIGV
jgi:chitosanase